MDKEEVVTSEIVRMFWIGRVLLGLSSSLIITMSASLLSDEIATKNLS